MRRYDIQHGMGPCHKLIKAERASGSEFASVWL
jgi:hypothetical protein